MVRGYAISLIALVALAACDEGPGGQMVRSAPDTRLAGGELKTLPQSGMGNSGGVLSHGSEAPAAGVEATMVYNAGGRANGAVVQFHNGPMTGVGVACTRAGGGPVVECTAQNATQAFLLNELSGSHAYAGAFAVNGYGPDQNQNGFVAIHASPTGAQYVLLPGEAVSYTGAFQAGGGLIHEGQRFNGRVNGTSTIEADFAAGTLGMAFNGQVIDDRTNLSAPLRAGVENAAIALDGRFYNTVDTTFSYGGQAAFGELDGAFYGPSAEEAAATFGFGNDLGGMTGIALGCSSYSATNCVAPTPRF